MIFLRKILNPEIYDSLELAEIKRFEPALSGPIAKSADWP